MCTAHNKRYNSLITPTLFVTSILKPNAWLNVMVSIDRVILMTYENRTAYNKRSPRLRESAKLFWIVLGIFVALCLINILNLFFELVPQTTTRDLIMNTTTIVGAQCTAIAWVSILRDTTLIVFGIVTPFLIQLVLSSFLIYKLIRLNAITLSLKKEYTFTLTIVISIFTDF